MAEYSVIGKRLPSVDAPDKATGAAQFTADIVLPGMLYGKVLRSPFPHARILSIDTSQAERLPGVKKVITGKDTAGITFGCVVKGHDQYPLAIGKVRHVGEAVVAVAAIDEDTAEDALELIKVEYEPLPAVYDPEEAIKEGAPQIHDKVTSPYGHDVEHNISRHVTWEYGEVDKGFAEAYLVREDRFFTQGQNHAPMEPHAAVATWDGAGNLTLWSSTQMPFFLRYNLAKTLAIPESKVRVIKPFVGGGFGGKVNMYAKDYCAARLSQLTGRPVKIVYTREEVFTATEHSYAQIMYLRTGMKKDGTLTSREMKLFMDNGAFNSTGPIIIFGNLGYGDYAQRLRGIRYDGHLVYTNKTPSGPLRGHTSQQVHFAEETQLDMMAVELGLDPVEVRLKNAVFPGYKRLAGDVTGSCTLKECIQSVVDRSGWREKRGKLGPYRGIGLAVGAYGGAAGGIVAYNPISVIVQLNADGRVTVLTGAADLGQGSTSTMAQITAEELGVSQDDVTVISADTAVTPFDHGSFGSRVTYHVGNATKLAAADTRRQLLAAIAETMEVEAKNLEIRDRLVYIKGKPEKVMPFPEALRTIQRKGKLPVIGTSERWYRADLGFAHSLPHQHQLAHQLSFYAQVAEVEVDPETGKIKGVAITYSHDCGTAINPMRVEGQLEGSIHMGVGMTLGEQMLMEDGQHLNPSFLDYKIPTALEMPEMEGGHEPSPGDDGPFGAKEAGEGAVLPTPPALVNAIYDATGVWFKELPVTPEMVVKALEEKRASEKPEKRPRRR